MRKSIILIFIWLEVPISNSTDIKQFYFKLQSFLIKNYLTWNNYEFLELEL